MADWVTEKRRERRRALRQEWKDIVSDTEQHDREWWRERALKERIDWSSLLRQRLRVKDWVRAGRPPIAEWIKKVSSR